MKICQCCGAWLDNTWSEGICVKCYIKIHPHNECEDCNIELGGNNAYTLHCIIANHDILYCACEDCE